MSVHCRAAIAKSDDKLNSPKNVNHLTTTINEHACQCVCLEVCVCVVSKQCEIVSPKSSILSMLSPLLLYIFSLHICTCFFTTVYMCGSTCIVVYFLFFFFFGFAIVAELLLTGKCVNQVLL